MIGGKNVQKLFIAIVISGAALAAGQAHAGMFEWMDKMFTFREDQRERVAPRRNLPPKIIQSPLYNTKEAQEWSDYYTRDNIKAVNYINGSASKVMRPNEEKTQRLAALERAKIRYQYDPIPQPQREQLVSTTPPSNSYGMAVQRDRMNHARQAIDTGRVYIGEAGTGPGMHIYDANVNTKTRISAPKPKWNAEPKPQFAPRKGDYDYKEPVQRQQGFAITSEDGHEIARSRGLLPMAIAPQEHVNQYDVMRGDTLSGISDKQAIYNDWKLWPLIYDANRTQIKDPDLIHPQQRLDIPRNYTHGELNNAKQRSIAKQAPHIYTDGY